MSVKCIVSCPISTYSGYGGRSRDFVRALIENYPDWDIKILPQRWGNTRKGFLEDNNDTLFLPRLIKRIEYKPDVWIQITIPNEFQPVGNFNIGVTAGVETTLCHPTWIEGLNRMDVTFASSNFAKETFERSTYTTKDDRTDQVVGQIKLNKPVEILFEGLDTEVYYEDKSEFDLSSIPEKFCFLAIGHWMQGTLGNDRKNIGYTIKAFLETFKNKPNKPALIVKTQQSTSSILDRDQLLAKIESIKNSVKGSIPNIYLLHGDLADEDINELYNHPKVKALLMLSKGEGFGRPMLEFAATGKPIISTNWSGHTDFLRKDLTALVNGELHKVDRSAAVKDIILEEAEWFKPDDGEVAAAMKGVFKDYKTFSKKAREQQSYILRNFTFDDMKEKQKVFFDQYIPEFPKEVKLDLPKLKLPKLKKIG